MFSKGRWRAKEITRDPAPLDRDDGIPRESRRNKVGIEFYFDNLHQQFACIRAPSLSKDAGLPARSWRRRRGIDEKRPRPRAGHSLPVSCTRRKELEIAQTAVGTDEPRLAAADSDNKTMASTKDAGWKEYSHYAASRLSRAADLRRARLFPSLKDSPEACHPSACSGGKTKEHSHVA